MASIQVMTIAQKKRTFPGNYSWGVKRNSQGKYEIWKGDNPLSRSYKEDSFPVRSLIERQPGGPILSEKEGAKDSGMPSVNAVYDAASL